MNNFSLKILVLPLAITSSPLLANKKPIDQIQSTPDKDNINIVFILSDDHRYDYLGFMGTVPWLETPGMDKMAKEGAWMKNAYVTTSLSSPSRASILTGLYSHNHKVVDNSAPIQDGLTFFPEYLQEANYKTAFFGKWHMGNDSGAPQAGFNHWESFKGQGEYYNPRINTNGEWIQYKDSTYVTDLLTQHALDFIEKNKDDNFMIYLSHKGVHDNFQAAKRHRGIYKDKQLVYPASFRTPHYDIVTPPTIDKTINKAKSGKEFYGNNMMPNWVKNQRESWHGVDYSYHGRTWEDQVRNYCETLRSVDESISSVINYLEENNLANNTIVVYMGDNGFAWGEHGLIDKRHFYEESVRVPMLVWAPGMIKEPIVIDNMIQNIDIAPTLMECAGLEKAEQMVGDSFIPLLNNTEIKWRDKIFYEYYWEHEFPQTPTMHGVRTDRYKYIRYHGIWDTNEFYDLEADPNEMVNLISELEYQDIIKELNHELYNWLETSDGMSIPLKRTERPHFDHRNSGNY